MGVPLEFQEVKDASTKTGTDPNMFHVEQFSSPSCRGGEYISYLITDRSTCAFFSFGSSIITL
jgi:hypothetical protein